MPSWVSRLRYDPVAPLTRSKDPVLSLFAGRDLLSAGKGPMSGVWESGGVLKILKKQERDGSWRAPKSTAGTGPKYSLLETWKNLRFLIERYRMTKEHPAVGAAAGFIFSCQTGEGDIRGILANQYAPYYTGAILYLLIKAGYQDDPRVDKGMEWLLDTRQDDGGWVIGSPGMIGMKWKDVCRLTSMWTAGPERNFDRSRPFSAAGTGMALRAFSVHPRWRRSAEALKAAVLLKSKFFKKDNWSWYGHPDNWLRFQFPFWWTNLVSALDTLSLLGVPGDDPDVKRALDWLVENQREDGLWDASYSKIHKNSNDARARELRPWITLCVCNILKRYWDKPG